MNLNELNDYINIERETVLSTLHELYHIHKAQAKVINSDTAWHRQAAATLLTAAASVAETIFNDDEMATAGELFDELFDEIFDRRDLIDDIPTDVLVGVHTPLPPYQRFT